MECGRKKGVKVFDLSNIRITELLLLEMAHGEGRRVGVGEEIHCEFRLCLDLSC